MDKITTVQTALAALGFRLQISGMLDEETVSALKDFQSNVLLEQSGEPDEATMQAIALLDNAWEGKDLPRENREMV
ncbi:MAG: peptidoglycan-binding protein [Coriobacteriia bacterium]|nr:peptidoglycan-binding protein [Coriobacteriia bacterium]